MTDLRPARHRRITSKVNKLLSAPEADAVGVAKAQTRGEWSSTLTTVSAIFGVAFVLALTQGILIYPGGLLLVWGARQLKPPRVVAVTSLGIRVYSTSFFSGGPKDLVCVLPLTPFPHANSKQLLTLGDELIKLSRTEYQTLANLTTVAVERRATQVKVQALVQEQVWSDVA